MQETFRRAVTVLRAVSSPPSAVPGGRVAQRTSSIVGHANSFLAAALLIVGWLITGPIFHYSDTWHVHAYAPFPHRLRRLRADA